MHRVSRSLRQMHRGSHDKHPFDMAMAFLLAQSRWRAVVARRAYLKRLALLNTTGDVVTRIQVGAF